MKSQQIGSSSSSFTERLSHQVAIVMPGLLEVHDALL